MKKSLKRIYEEDILSKSEQINESFNPENNLRQLMGILNTLITEYKRDKNTEASKFFADIQKQIYNWMKGK